MASLRFLSDQEGDQLAGRAPVATPLFGQPGAFGGRRRPFGPFGPGGRSDPYRFRAPYGDDYPVSNAYDNNPGSGYQPFGGTRLFGGGGIQNRYRRF